MEVERSKELKEGFPLVNKENVHDAGENPRQLVNDEGGLVKELPSHAQPLVEVPPSKLPDIEDDPSSFYRSLYLFVDSFRSYAAASFFYSFIEYMMNNFELRGVRKLARSFKRDSLQDVLSYIFVQKYPAEYKLTYLVDEHIGKFKKVYRKWDWDVIELKDMHVFEDFVKDCHLDGTYNFYALSWYIWTVIRYTRSGLSEDRATAASLKNTFKKEGNILAGFIDDFHDKIIDNGQRLLSKKIGEEIKAKQHL